MFIRGEINFSARTAAPSLTGRDGVGLLLEGFARHAFQLEILLHIALKGGVGAEDDLVAADHVGRLELLAGENLLGVALTLKRDLESAEVFEHYHLSFEERLDDVVFHGLEHYVAVRLGHGGAVVDTLGELLEIEFASFHCGTLVVLRIGIFRVATTHYFVSNHRFFKWGPPLTPPVWGRRGMKASFATTEALAS